MKVFNVSVSWVTVLPLTMIAFVLSGCATTDQPHFSGKQGVTPTIDDYYPSATASNDWRPQPGR
jgi:hypothetical protein